MSGELGGDPAKLLGLSGQSRFQAGEPAASGTTGAQVSVTFPTGQGGKPKTTLFQLQRQGDRWLIESVGSSEARR